MRVLDFSDGFTSATEPLQGNVEANSLKVFASDADFVTDKGSAAEQGDLYSRSTDDVIRYYDGTSWVSLASLDAVNTLIAAHTGDSADAHAASAITNTPSGNLAATTVQGALNELQSDVDTRATSSALASHEADTTAIHGIADTSLLVTTTGAQVITNKDIDGGTASNTSRITIPKASKATLDALTRKEATVVYASDTDKLYYDDGSILKLVGSGSGGETNFVTDGDAEGANVISTYNDSSTTRPVDGTSGTATNLASSISSTSPLIGSNSFLLSKTGSASTQGKGWSVPFTIDSAYKAKVLQIEFDYIVNSGTFVAGSSSAESDVIVYIYDVTNSQLIEPSSIKLLSNSATISDKYVANFQTSATGTSYRLIFHCQSTSASNYELKIDNITVKPSRYVYGTPITDWQTYSPVLRGSTNGSTYTNQSTVGRYRRVGDTLELDIYTTFSGTPGTGTGDFQWTLPSGLSMDSAKMAVQGNNGTLGSFSYTDSGTAFYNNVIPAYSSSTAIGAMANGASASMVNLTSPITWAINDNIKIIARVPIQGWSSSVQMSDGYDGRLVAARYTNAAGTSIPTSIGTAPWATKDYDTTGSFSSDIFTAPSSGIYEVNLSMSTQSQAWAANSYFYAGLAKNGTSVTQTIAQVNVNSAITAGVTLAGTAQVLLVAGDTLRIRYVSSDSGHNLTASSVDNWVTFKKLQAPTTISATEVVAAKYTGTTTGSIGAAANVTTYPTKVFDTHNAYSGGAYTAPVSGIYQIIASNDITGTESLNSETTLLVTVDGSTNSYLASHRSPGTVTNTSISGSALVQVNAGQLIRIALYTDIGSPAYTSNTIVPSFSIHRIK